MIYRNYENVTQVVSYREAELTDMMTDLGRFRSEIFTTHLTFDPNPQSIQDATKNVEKVKESLDSWRDRIKERLDAIDELCRDEADSMTPEQFGMLREKRRLLAEEYDMVLRNVEGIHSRLNILAALLIEFSSLTSSMQSWMTDRTRFGGDIRHKSADPQRLDEARLDVKSLLEEVQNEEYRLKNIGASVNRIEREIESMYDDLRSTSTDIPSGVNINEVHDIRRRVEDDYSQLLKQCQDLIQFQNRVYSMNDEHAERARRADEWLNGLEKELVDIEKDGRWKNDEERMRRIEEINRMAAGGSVQLDEAESASRRLVNALEGTNAAEDVRRRHEEMAGRRRDNHRDVLDRLQQNLNEAASRKAAAEGVKQAVENMKAWSQATLRKTNEPVELPLNDVALNEARRDEQVLHGEIESRLVLVDELEQKAKDVGDMVSVEELGECRKRLKRSNSDLNGLRDNIFDALNGLVMVNTDGEKLSRDSDVLASKIRATNGRDAGKIAELDLELQKLKQDASNLEQVAKNLFNIPNVVATEPVALRVAELRKRVDSCSAELEAKRGKLAELDELEHQFEDSKARTKDWLNKFDDDLKNLEKVSIDKEKLSQQRAETIGMMERHGAAQEKVDELEGLAQRVGDSGASVREVNGRILKQAGELKARSDRINKNDSKVSDFEDAEKAVMEYMDKKKDILATMPIPTTREGVSSQMAELERMDKTGRSEMRRVEEARLMARELVKEALVDGEAEEMAKKEKRLAENWEALADAFDVAREKARMAEKVLDEMSGVEKWIGGKRKMVEMIGAPSTDAVVGKTQKGQLEFVKVEAEEEKEVLDGVNRMAKELIGGGEDGGEELGKKMDNLNRRWHSLESGLNEKSARIDGAAKLGEELRDVNKKLKNELGELESNVEKASTMAPNDIGEQLATLDSLKSRFGGVDQAIEKLKHLLDTAEDLEIDATNRAEIKEQLESTQKKADELERKIDNVKKAALNAQNEGVEHEKKLDELIGVVGGVQTELEQAAPICADAGKLGEDGKRAEMLYGLLVEKEGDFSLLKAKLADDLKKKPDANLKRKLDDLVSKWAKTMAAARERKDLVAKAADLLKQFNDGETALVQRLDGDRDELNVLLAENDGVGNMDGLKLVEMTMARRLADVDALNGLMTRIEASAPGPDANRLRRKADKLADDCKGMAKKARLAAAQAQRKFDFETRFARLVEEVGGFADGQKEKIGEMVEKEQMNGERVQSKLNEVEDFWSLKSRELKTVGDEIKDNNPDETARIDGTMLKLSGAINELLSMLKEQSQLLEVKKEAAERVAAESQKATHRMNALMAEIADLDPIGRDRDELKRQKDEMTNLAENVDGAETGILELMAEWEAALEAGVVGKPAFEMNKANVEELNKLATRARKRLAQREKKLNETEDEIDKLHRDADGIINSIHQVAEHDAFSPSQNDPKQIAAAVKRLKEEMKPIGEKMDGFNSDCKLMIKTAGPDASTKELDGLLKSVGDTWSDIVGKVSDKEINVDQAVQQQGRVEDAYRSLLNWLEETEEMMENQKKPSADAKVAKAQLHAYEVLMKHVEDKQASVDGFGAMIRKLKDSDQEKLRSKDEQVQGRYQELLANGQDRQRKLLDAVDLAERLQEVVVPLDQWLSSAEKRLQGLSKVPITVEKAEKMLEEQEQLQEELGDKSEELRDVMEISPHLTSLVSVEDAMLVSQQTQQLENRARQLDTGITSMKPLLEDFLQQIQDFTMDSEDMTRFIGETELKLCELDELPIEPEDLAEQSNILAEITAAITDRDEMMTNIFDVGKQLAIQGERDEALEAQRKLDDLKFRYTDLMSSADEKIVLLTKAIPLSERFHEGFNDVMELLEAMERDLLTIDDEDPETQSEWIQICEEDITKLRPTVDELAAISTQLQALCSADKAEELHSNTSEMNRLTNSVAERVARRAERIEMASKQSRVVLDDLNYLVEWFTAARDRSAISATPSLDPEYLRYQLKQQRVFNEEANANKVQFRNVSNEAKKVARSLGVDGPEADKISDYCDQTKELVEDVMGLCADRTEMLERALALAEHLTSQFDELHEWLDEVEKEIQESDSVTTATPAAELRLMHDHNLELSQMISAYRPIVDGFKGDVAALQEICAEDQANLLGSVAGELVSRYEEVKEAIRGRGVAIDNMMDTTIGFGERLETLVANLQGAADRLTENQGISADPNVLESKLAENQSIVESLRDKQNAYDALKQSANELLANAPMGDEGAGDVEQKLNRLEKLWKDIEKEAVDRGELLGDVLEKAKRFWSELDACQKAVDDLRNRLELVEPATGHPEQLADQQEMMAQVANEMEKTRPRIEALSVCGQQLAVYVPDDEKAVIDAQVANVHGGFTTITGLFAEKKRDLIAAMEEAMAFHGDLRALLEWLELAEGRLVEMVPVESAKQMGEVGKLLEELHAFKDEVSTRGVSKEQVVSTALQLAADAPPHLAATVRQPVAELNGRWTRLNAALAEREHKLESSLLQMGKLTDAIAQLDAWMEKTKATLVDIAPPRNAVNLRDIEIAKCKLNVVSNDVHSHQLSVDTVNNAAIQYAKSSGGLDGETTTKLGEMNTKWDQIQRMLAALAAEMDIAKREAENVGGEVEKWQTWLEEAEQQLMSTKPTGGLPETAEFQLDEFRMLKTDVEQNSGELERHLMAQEVYLIEEKVDAQSWLAKTHSGLKTKWNKVKELLVDREKKLQLAYEQAIALEQALNEMENWIIDAERKLTDQPPISRLPDIVGKQLMEHETWMDEVGARKAAMGQHQAAGVRMQYYCEKKDAIPIKNRLVSLKHRVEKISSRTADRGKQLIAARDEVALWQDGCHELDAFISTIMERITPDTSVTSSLDKLKSKLDEVKEAQNDVQGKQALFDITRKRGIGLAERATRGEYKTIGMANEKVSKRWNEMVKKIRDRLREAEQAVLEGGAFEESMQELETWVDAELDRYAMAEKVKVFGDTETVRTLVDEEARRAAERKMKENGVKTVVKKADALMANGVDESDAIRLAKERLVEKWGEVEEAARQRGDSIKEAEMAAEEFDGMTRGLLDWLAVEEQKLKVPAINVQSALNEVDKVKKELNDALPKYTECLAKGTKILEKCQPKAEPTLRNWMRVVEARWKEVMEKVDEKEFGLLEEEQKEKERDEMIGELAEFAAKKREQLNVMIDRPLAQNLEEMDENLREMSEMDAALREKQPDVDAACKTSKKGGIRNMAAEQLSTEWKKIWLDAMGLQSSLDAQKALLAEMKRLEGWKWEDWKERYVEWNDHAKARVSDLFRRIDRLHTGNVPRQVFIDGIIGSKFPTSRLEMEKVANIFDKGDGMINSKEFINALRFDLANRNAKPQTDTEKIKHEIERQKQTCSCCQPYQIEKISENHYRFGDTHIKRMVRILRSTVMVRVGGGWESLDEFLHKHDPCRAKGRLNINMFPEAKPTHAMDSMRAFTKNRHEKLPMSGTPGPIMKIREKTDRSVPMSGGLGGTAGYTVTGGNGQPSRIPRAPSDMSAGRLSRVNSQSNSRSSLIDSNQQLPSRPSSRASSDAGDKQSRIPSLRMKKGARYNPPK